MSAFPTNPPNRLDHGAGDRPGVGFAQRLEALAALHAEVSGCRRCVEAGFIPEAQPVFQGAVGQRLMIVGQAPGPGASRARERLRVPAAGGASRRLPYSGATGRTLVGWLARAGFPPERFRERFYLTSLTKCFPGKAAGGKGDRAPSAREIALCRAHLDWELALVRPEVVVTLGRLAAVALCPEARRLPLAAVVGTVREAERAGHRFLVVPLPHPSGVSRWLNEPAHRARLELGLAALGRLRGERGL